MAVVAVRVIADHYLGAYLADHVESRVDCRIEHATGDTYDGFTERTCAALAARLDNDGVVRTRLYGAAEADDPDRCAADELPALTAQPRWTDAHWHEGAPLKAP